MPHQHHRQQTKVEAIQPKYLIKESRVLQCLNLTKFFKKPIPKEETIKQVGVRF